MNSNKITEDIANFANKPKFTIVSNAVKSHDLSQQLYTHFELINLNDISDQTELLSGDYVLFLNDITNLTDSALYHFALEINENQADFIYSHDQISVNNRVKKHYKSQWNLDLILQTNFINNSFVISTKLLNKIEEKELDFTNSHKLILSTLVHKPEYKLINEILFQYSETPLSNPSVLGLQKYYSQNGIELTNTYSETNAFTRKIIGSPKVSIIIPFKDQPGLLDACVKSIFSKTDYQNYEIIAVNNGSESSLTFDTLKILKDLDSRFQVIDYNHPFNYSAINNFAVQHSTGEHILLLNNDTEVISPNWLGELLRHSQREEIGAVGAKLLFPDNTVQHAGIVAGVGGMNAAGYFNHKLKSDAEGYFSRMKYNQCISAVTGACLMVKKELYLAVGGLNEHELKIAYNDVDFCLRLIETGVHNLFTPEAVLYHYESKSRGKEDSLVKKRRLKQEADYLKTRHASYMLGGDPYVPLEVTRSSPMDVSSYRIGSLKLLRYGIDKLYSKIGRIGKQNMALFGAGLHTQRLLSETDLAPHNISFIIDDSAPLDQLNNIPIVKSENISTDNIQVIIISSDSKEELLLDRVLELNLKNVIIVTMYSDTIIDL